METINRRMSSDMSGPLSDTPDGTTANTQVANTCPPAGERPNKKPIFISGVCDTRSFLAWLRVSWPGGLMAQLKGEKSSPSSFSSFFLWHYNPWPLPQLPPMFSVLWLPYPIPCTCKSLFMLGCLCCFHLVSGFKRFSRYIYFLWG